MGLNVLMVMLLSFCVCRGGRNSTSGLRVRKFRQEDYHDDSEEDGTYNGNSTQQQ